MTHYLGECYCGAVTFQCEGEPFFTQYCHCEKCREVASQSKRETDKRGYSWTAGYLKSSFKLTSGKDHLDEIIRNNSKLLLCQSCHSLIYGISLDPGKQGGIGVNANNFILTVPLPDSFKP